MKKGFTLIELLAVIAILGILALIVVPNVAGSLKNQKNNLYQVQINNIEEATAGYASENFYKLVGYEDTVCKDKKNEDCTVETIYLKDLVGFIDTDIDNPIAKNENEKQFSKCLEIEIIRAANTSGYVYKVNEDTISNDPILCVEENDTDGGGGNIIIKPEVTDPGDDPDPDIPGEDPDPGETPGDDPNTGTDENDCYEKGTCKPNEPDLLNNSLTPVVYDEEKGSWVVADTSKKWYDYSNQEWANAVILRDDVTKNVGDTVKVPTSSDVETDVVAMYVWIPRYSYTIKCTNIYDDGTSANCNGKTLSGANPASADYPGAIDIKFISEDVVETGTAKYAGDTATNWRTHPAFQWDTNSDGTITNNENIKGIWVGKFKASNVDTTVQNSSTRIGTINNKYSLYMLPNTSPTTIYKVAEGFNSSQTFGTYLTNNTSVDSHMMKNSEWGAVAYLSQSTYGKYGNSTYSGSNKIIYGNGTSYNGYATVGWKSGNSSGRSTFTYDEGVNIIVSRINGTYVTPTVTNDTKNPWTIDDETYLISTSKNDKGLTSTLEMEFKLDVPGLVSFDLMTNYGDTIAYTIKDKNGVSVMNGRKVGKTSDIDAYEYENFIKFLDAGEYVMTFKYNKTNNGTKGYAGIKNIEISGYKKTYEYLELSGRGASTTGTIYGIYDMSGEFEESVMAVYTSEFNATNYWGYYGGNFVENLFGFSSAPASKYYDNYTKVKAIEACNGGLCYGHALGELAKYNEYLSFSNTSPWLTRSKYHQSLNSLGIYAAAPYYGHDGIVTFRSVLLREG